jgi:hypothetical protein
VVAGSISLTASTLGASGVTRYDFDWTSDASGDVNSTSSDIKRGEIFQIRFKPDSGGTQPSDLYDVQLQDSDNVDLLNDGSSGRGSNLSNATGAYMQWDPPIWHDGANQVELVVSNAGNAKGGVVSLWVRDRDL